MVCPVDSEASRPALAAAAGQVRILQFERFALTDTDYVGVDQLAGMTQVVDHLKEQGATDVIFVGHQHRISSLNERAAAFSEECVRQGVAARTSVCLPLPNTASGRDYARTLIAAKDIPDGIVCANDEVALGLLPELQAAGVRCPDDLLVIGYDDVPAAELMGLTSVRQPLDDLGREAARLLSHPSTSARQVRLAPELVVRRSSARN